MGMRRTVVVVVDGLHRSVRGVHLGDHVRADLVGVVNHQPPVQAGDPPHVRGHEPDVVAHEHDGFRHQSFELRELLLQPAPCDGVQGTKGLVHQEELGIERVRFHELRTKALQAGIEALTPKKPGRKRKVKSAEELRIEELERKVRDLKQEVYTQSMKEAIHIALGVRADGRKEVLGLWLEQNEGAKF